jgi:energy-coupling factor transporter ATP-binding protein EcfA2
MMKKGNLPIHGSMINCHFKNNKTIGVVFIGDSGAGKSETIEAMEMLNHPDLLSMDVVFDDMGTFMIEDGKIVAQGSEIGAFIRLDDLDKGSPYKSMDRSIFMNPDSVNARIIVPITPYQLIIKKHKVDFVFYANNYTDKTGYDIAKVASDIQDVFVQGKRMALATTHETGLSTTYFANPFGPMQDQARCDVLLDRYFKVLDNTQVQVGEVYTGLGVKDHALNHLKQTGSELLELFANYIK